MSTPLQANWRELNWAVNLYRCEKCQHVMTTVDVDAGTTPFMAACPKCDGSAMSACYPHARPIPQWVPEPSEEWYQPTKKEVKKLDPGSREHVNMGGLLRRKWTGKTPIPNPYGPATKSPTIPGDAKAAPEIEGAS